MYNLTAKRTISITLAVLLVLTFTIINTGSADAASKKTVYLLTKIKDSDASTTTTRKFDKRGLLKSEFTKSKYEKFSYKYTRTKKGVIKETRNYSSGKLNYVDVNTVNKKGRITKTKYYEVRKGKKRLYSSEKHFYYKNGNRKKTIGTNKDLKEKTTTLYYKNGNIKSETSVSKGEKLVDNYDKNGRPVKSIHAFKGYNTTTTTWQYETNSKGYVTRQIKTSRDVPKIGGIVVEQAVSTFTYDSHGNITRKVIRTTWPGLEEMGEETRTCTFKYKAKKVAKKYLKLIKADKYDFFD